MHKNKPKVILIMDFKPIRNNVVKGLRHPFKTVNIIGTRSLRKLKRLIWLSTNKKIALFPREISDGLKIPFSLQLLNRDKFSIFSRSNHEMLLREIAITLIKNSNSSEPCLIVDIGAWIGDNAIVWAKYTESKSIKILAIDPFASNISFIREISRINSIKNIDCVAAVCSSKAEDKYSLSEGNWNHGTFTVSHAMPSNKCIKSTTIDNLIKEKAPHHKLFLLHVDVEGMEPEVIEGAFHSIKENKAFVIFENHIKTERVKFKAIINILSSAGYNIFMINEIIPGCRADCRNFLAIHRTKEGILNKLQCCCEALQSSESFTPATVPDKALIQIW